MDVWKAVRHCIVDPSDTLHQWIAQAPLEEEALEVLARRFRLTLNQLLSLQTHNRMTEKVIIIERFGIYASRMPQDRQGAALC